RRNSFRAMRAYILTCALAVVLHGFLRADEKPPRPKPVPAPAPEAIDSSIKRGIGFLLKDQNQDGSWGTPNRTKGLNIYAPVPDAHVAFRAAVTALGVSALIDVGSPTTNEDVKKAVERGENWLFANLPAVHRSSADALYNVWSHIYGIDALVRMYDRLPNDTA